ncbi:MAG: nucleoside-triphosphatase [Candidatus Omnitrophica bacterium]|nr:nucleoside-triphosphatase [Candidatus Omnitrophota bacterium]MCM8801926.1 nucleoside-triphosphatase [Candidatus Omnitrophota bacterium]
MKNILVTGLPGTGKTTLIKQVLNNLDIEKIGFYTEEIREKGERVGFKIVTFSGKEVILSHKDYATPYRVSKYYVSIENLEKIAVKEIEKGISKKNCLIVIDEIGKMELISERFKKVVIYAFESPNKVLATVMYKPEPFCDILKKREDTKIFILDKTNFGIIKDNLVKQLTDKIK